MDLERPRRVNGLGRPYTAAQISTWIFLPTLVIEFFFFVSPILPIEAAIPCTLLFFGLAACSVYFGYISMKIDPADPRLNPHECDTAFEGATKQCWICDTQVGEKSMHCKFCNKCVDHFDHHCMCKFFWGKYFLVCSLSNRALIFNGLTGLNTCVGKANYPYFFRTMISITLLLLVHGSIQLALVIDIFVGNGNSQLRAENWFQADATIAIVVVLCIFLFFDLAAISLIVQLLAFHLKLQREGLTTYAFIVRDNQRRREKTKLENELVAKRGLEIAKAKEDGRLGYRFRLEAGGYFRKTCGMEVCDPLRGDQKQDRTEEAADPIERCTNVSASN
jgi:hypothetical protein